MNNKLIIYLGGGSMSGIFGAGLVTAFQDMDFYDKIEAIYGGSAGAINAAYFLSKQTKLGSSIYYEDLIKNFIFPLNVPLGIAQRFWNRYIRELQTKKILNAVDIDYAINLVKYKKQLNVENIKKQNIKLYVKLLNVSNCEIEYLDAQKNDILMLLKAAISISPYYFNSQKINEKEYIDGTIKEPIGLSYILRKHPNNKIIVVINEPIIRGIKHYAKNFLEGLVARTIHKDLFQCFTNRESLVRKDIKEAINNKRVLLISPSRDNPTIPKTTDYNKLIATYNMGKREAEKIKDFLKNKYFS